MHAFEFPENVEEMFFLYYIHSDVRHRRTHNCPKVRRRDGMDPKYNEGNKTITRKSRGREYKLKVFYTNF